MKKLLLLPLLLFAVLLPQQSFATNAHGTDLEYINLAPNVYYIKYNFYSECGGATPANTQILTYRASGCSAGDTLTLTERSFAPIYNFPYCEIVGVSCIGGAGAAPNYVKHSYYGTLTLPTVCSNWILSIRDSSRSPARNLSSVQGAGLYTEAFLNNQFTNSNNSPNFNIIPIPYVCVNNSSYFFAGAVDAEGDSLVFSLQPALSDENLPVQYSSRYSATNPFGPQATGFTFDPATGATFYTPVTYDSVSPAAAGLNKYVVAVQVEEYRQDSLTGNYVKIGHVRRDAVVNFYRCTPNQLPFVETLTVNADTISNLNQIIDVVAGQPFSLKVLPADPDSTDRIVISTDFPDVFVGGRFAVTGGARPFATLIYTPQLSEVRSQPYKFSVSLRDDNCPFPGTTNQEIQIRVIAGATGVKEDLASKYKLQTLLNSSLQQHLKLSEELAGATVNIYDLNGRLIKSYKNYDNSWNSENAPAGMYIYTVEHKGLKEPITSKLVVLK